MVVVAFSWIGLFSIHVAGLKLGRVMAERGQYNYPAVGGTGYSVYYHW